MPHLLSEVESLAQNAIFYDDDGVVVVLVEVVGGCSCADKDGG